MATQIKLGVVGLGVASSSVLPAAVAMPEVEVVAGADINPKALEIFREKYGRKTYGSMEELCADPEVNAIWVATPNPFHKPHVVMAANAGKHVIVEKPMAISLAETQEMIDAAEQNHVHLLSGGSRSASSVVRKMREILLSGELGRLRALTTWAATDWMLRPRRPEELDVSKGGGVGYRQSPHQIDSVRLLAGGMVRSVRAATGQWMAPRDTAPGFYTAFLEFADGTPATLIYEAYGYFMAGEFFEPDSDGGGTYGADERARIRREIVTGARDELAAKEALTLAAQRGGGMSAGRTARRSSFLSDLGLLVVTCEHGDMRQSPNGIYVYNDDGVREIPLEADRSSYSPELMELYEAINHGKPILHGGRWGQATLEVSLAIMQSGREHRELTMYHQVPVPEGA